VKKDDTDSKRQVELSESRISRANASGLIDCGKQKVTQTR
jgi:hypothetical protein